MHDDSKSIVVEEKFGQMKYGNRTKRFSIEIRKKTGCMLITLQTTLT